MQEPRLLVLVLPRQLPQVQLLLAVLHPPQVVLGLLQPLRLGRRRRRLRLRRLAPRRRLQQARYRGAIGEILARYWRDIGEI